MLRRIVEIAENDRYLSVDRGFLVVRSGEDVFGRVPLDDIGVLIGNAHGLTYSGNALAALAERGAPVLLCGSNHRPTALVWPLVQHHEQAGRFKAQIAVSRPTCKRLWKELVQQKILEQAAVLRALGRTFKVVERLSMRVRAGDPSNIEAQAAKYYWRALFGKSFSRDVDGAGINSLLNYGYAVLRAATARAVVATGLHPSLGVFHKNPRNSFQLVDDLMEPYRPVVDIVVHQLWSCGIHDVTPDSKRQLAMAMYRDRAFQNSTTPVCRCIELTAASFAAALDNPRARVLFPDTISVDFLRGGLNGDEVGPESEAAA
jgi:CRISPR-associated protein Cas1